MKQTLSYLVLLFSVIIGSLYLADWSLAQQQKEADKRGDEARAEYEADQKRDYIDVEVAVAVSDYRHAPMQQNQAIEVMAQGIWQPANKIAASVGPSRRDSLSSVRTNVEGKLIAAEIVKVRLKRIK